MEATRNPASTIIRPSISTEGVKQRNSLRRGKYTLINIIEYIRRAQCGGRTHDIEIKSLTLYQLS